MFRETRNTPGPQSLVCPDCGSTRFRVGSGKVECTNCGWTEKMAGSNKYGAKRTEARDGMKRDSKFEASVADMLDLRKRGKDIIDYDSQYKVEMWIYREDGVRAFHVDHKVDFRLHHKDGSFELLEAKGAETADYRWRRRLLEEVWLPMHPDHTYTVVKQQRRAYNNR